jgi:hypothetical protein
MQLVNISFTFLRLTAEFTLVSKLFEFLFVLCILLNIRYVGEYSK